MATDLLCEIERIQNPILEPSCGEGHISKRLIAHGYEVVSRDLVDRGYGEVADFLAMDNVEWEGDIITNPPYSFAQEFVEKALSIVPEGHKVAMFLKLTFLEGKRRAEFFRCNPPIRVWVSSSRLKCAMNGDFDSVGEQCHSLCLVHLGEGLQGASRDTVVQLAVFKAFCAVLYIQTSNYTTLAMKAS